LINIVSVSIQRERLVGNLRALGSGWRSSWVVHEEAACWKVPVMTSPREGFVRFRSILWRRRRSLVGTVPSASKADEPRTLLCQCYSSGSTPATLSHRQTAYRRPRTHWRQKSTSTRSILLKLTESTTHSIMSPLCTRPNDC